MWVYFGMMGILGILFLISANIAIPSEITIPVYRKPFYKMAVKLSEIRGKIPGKFEQKNEIAKMENMILVLFLGMAIVSASGGITIGKQVIQEGNVVNRPDKGQGNSVQKLEAAIETLEEVQEFEITLHERKYSVNEKQEILTKAITELENLVLGENESADEIRGRVGLPAKLQEGQVLVEWIQEPQNLLDTDGKIREDIPKEGTLLQLTAILTCEDQSCTHQMGLMLYPMQRTLQEQLLFDLQEQLKRNEESSSEYLTMKLPEEIDGREITWIEKERSLTGILMALVIMAACFAYFGKESEIRDAKEKRRRQLLLDYPDLLFKLGMLLNTGLTMQNAFTKIAMEYKELRDKEGSRTQMRFVYEEMISACNEMKSGISEAKAYERFGKRCEETCYVKLGTTLSGSLQKSSEGLTKLLLDEAVLALEDRRQLAKKLGEEAGTKLLFPMILMLMVVLVILMVPAVLSF